MRANERQSEEDMTDMYDYFSDDKEFQKLIPEIDASVAEITPTAPIIDCLKTEETKVKPRRKYVNCSICQKVKRSDHLKRRMKTHGVSDCNTIHTSTIVQPKAEKTKVKRLSKYRNHVVCCICERVMRSDYLKKHMRKKSHAMPNESDIVHGKFIEKLSTEVERKHIDIMSTIPEQYLETKKHYSLDTYQRFINQTL